MKTKSIFTILAVALAYHCVSAENFTLNPFIQLRNEKSVTVMWETKSNAVSWLEYGSSTALTHTAYFTVDGLRNANTTRHKAIIDSLSPGQSFYYRAVAKPVIDFRLYATKLAEPVATPVYTGKMPPGQDQPVRVVIYNDLHNRTKTFEKLAALTKDFDFDLSMFNGDCIADPQNEKHMVNILRFFNADAKAAERPVVYLRGNHETRGAYARSIRNWLAPLNGKFYGAFSAGPVRFIILDAGEDKDDAHPGYHNLNDFKDYRKAQADFLKKELQTPEFKQAKYHVLVHHIPLYDKSKHIAASSREFWEPILKDAPISLAISGHTHSPAFYKKGEIGNPYPVLIGGGPGLKEATLVLLEADKKRLKVRMLDVKGKQLAALQVPASAQQR